MSVLREELEAAERSSRFPEAMSHLASAVLLVTSCVDGRPWGMTVSACCSVSDEPPTMLVSLLTRTVLSRAIMQTSRFGVCVLGADAIEVARFGSSSGQPKFLDDVCGVSPREAAAVVVEGSLSHVDCDVAQSLEHGDHTLYIGRVRAITVPGAGDPLLYYRRDYRRLQQVAA
jgi:flavin reductase (DIM6/NTAB) family NADH-FMN oxidoreductase RutF